MRLSSDNHHANVRRVKTIFEGNWKSENAKYCTRSGLTNQCKTHNYQDPLFFETSEENHTHALPPQCLTDVSSTTKMFTRSSSSVLSKIPVSALAFRLHTSYLCKTLMFLMFIQRTIGQWCFDSWSTSSRPTSTCRSLKLRINIFQLVLDKLHFLLSSCNSLTSTFILCTSHEVHIEPDEYLQAAFLLEVSPPPKLLESQSS